MFDAERIYTRITNKFPDIEVIRGEPMSRHTSFRIGGPADIMAFPETAEELSSLRAFAYSEKIDTLVIGKGSNLLVSDLGIRGLVIKTTRAASISLDKDSARITADAGALLSRLAMDACEAGLTGLEFAHGIPGTAGGAVFMNAGAYDGEMSLIVRTTDYCGIDGVTQTLRGDEHEFSYRSSFFSAHPELVILRTVVSLENGSIPEIRAKIGDFSERRKTRQPIEYPSAGSVFKRPPGLFAGTLIEECGLKGFHIGGAQVSEKHAGFIINTGGATCDDVARLIAHIQETVLKHTGVELFCEVRRIGGLERRDISIWTL